MPIISEQVKILLERMDMHPEEFVHPFESRNIEPKWHGLLHNGAFGIVEKFLIKRKYNALRRKVTQEMILATIMYEGEKEDDDLLVRHSTVGRFNAPSHMEKLYKLYKENKQRLKA
jgi:hypothetical protein